MLTKIDEMRLLSTSKFIEQKEYWQNRLSGGIVRTEILADIKKKHKSGKISPKIEKTGITIPDDICNCLMKFTKKLNPSIYIFLLAALNILIHKYANQEDIIVISPLYKLNLPGEIINRYVLIRNGVRGETSFKELLVKTRESVLEAYKNQDYPIERLLEYFSKEAGPSFEGPASDIECSLMNIHDHNHNGRKKAGFTFLFEREADHINGHILFDTNYFDRYYAGQLSRHFTEILKNITNQIEITISAVSMLSEQDKRQLIHDFNNNRTDFLKARTLHQLIEVNSARKPGNTAISFEDEAMSYGKLNTRANRLARHLRGCGVRADQPVGILLKRSANMVESIIAVWKAGGAYIPIDLEYPVQRIAGMLRDSGACVLISQTGGFPPGLESLFKGKIIMVDRQYDGIEEDLNLEIDMNHLAYVIYTSGSTGKPKGVMVEHIGMMNHIQAKVNDLQITGSSIIAQNSSHTFDISVWQFFTPLTRRGKTVIFPDDVILEPDQFIDRLVKDKVTILEVVPSYLSVMLDVLDDNFRSFDQLRYLLVTGETVKPHLAARWFENYPGIKMVNAYGPTEASDDITHHIMDKAPDRERIPLGKPLQNLNIYIVNEGMNLVPVGIKGEIWVSGFGVGRGYLNNVEKTCRVFGENPFRGKKGIRLYKTGDLGCWLPDGTIDFFGRRDYQVKIRGYRIELGEIERKLVNHTEVKEAVVMDREDAGGRKYLCAYVVTNGILGVSELKEYLSAHLPAYMIPSYLIKLEQLPLTPNGKINRKALPHPGDSSGAIPYITEDMMKQAVESLKKRPEGMTPFGERHPGIEAKVPYSFIIIGETTLPIKCAEILLRRGHHVQGIISSEARVAAWSQANNVPFSRCRKTDILSFLKEKSFDYLISANNLYILPEEVLALPSCGTLNYHNALLPAYAGSYAPYRAVMNREKNHGITWHVVDSGIDTGDIVKQVQIDIDEKETGGSLNMKCYYAGAEAFEELVEEIEKGGLTRQTQDFRQRTYFGKYDRPVPGGVISFTWDAERIDAFTRALNFGDYENPLGIPRLLMGKDFFILPRISILDSASQQPPGTIFQINNDSITISTATNDIKVREIFYINGRKITIPGFVKKFGLYEGYVIPDIDRKLADRFDEYDSKICRYENFWVKRLNRMRPLRFTKNPGRLEAADGSEIAVGCREILLPGELKSLQANVSRRDFLIAAFAAYLSSITGMLSFDIGYTDNFLQHDINGLEGIFAKEVPLHVEMDSTQSLETFSYLMQKELNRIRKRKTYSRDILYRYPQLYSKTGGNLHLGVTCAEDFPPTTFKQLTFVIPEKGNNASLFYNKTIIDEGWIDKVQHRFITFLGELLSDSLPGIFRKFPVDTTFRARTSNEIELNGIGIEPEEIEDCLLEHHAIKEALVMVKGDKDSKKYLCAYMISDSSLMEANLKEYLSGKLPDYMIPANFVQLENFPVTVGGEIDKELLSALEIETGGGESSENYVAPRNEVEEELVRIWSEVLGIEKGVISIDCNFFEIGGHSLNATIMAARIHKKMNVKLPLAEVFKTPNIIELARYIKESAQERFISIEPTEEMEYYPLSSAQKRLFVLQQMDPDATAYNVPLMTPLSPGVNVEKNKLERAIYQLINRHESFCTSIEVIDKEPVQRIHEMHCFDFRIEYYHLKNDDHRGEPGANVIGTIFKNFIKPFNLSIAPNVRVGMIITGEGRYILMADMHHIITDGISVKIFEKEFTELYWEKELSPLRLQYKDFSLWQNRMRKTGVTAGQEAYWLKRFEGGVPVLNLPVDFERGDSQQDESGSKTFVMNKETTEQLNRLAQEEDVTFYIVLMTIYNLLLAFVSGQKDIVVGIPIAGRLHADLGNIIGFFVNMLALRSFPDDEMTFREFLQEVKRSTLEAYENQDYQFDDLVAKLVTDRNLNRNQLINVVFNFDNITPAPDPSRGTITEPKTSGFLESEDIKISLPAVFDLQLSAREVEKTLFFSLVYSAVLFKSSTIDEMVRYYISISEQVIKNKDVRLKEIVVSHGLLAANSMQEDPEEFGF